MIQTRKLRGCNVSNLYWLSEEHMGRLRPYFPKSHGMPRVDDQRVLSGIIFINRNGLRWCDAPKEYGPYKTLYNRWKRWSDMGVFARIMMGLAAQKPDNSPTNGGITMRPTSKYIAQHPACGSKRGAWTPDRSHQGRYEYETACSD